MAVEVPAVSARCRLVGASQVEREDTFMDIASDYFVAVSESCQTSILVSALTLDQQIDWFGYILKYTTVLFECETDPSPLIGGIGAFGPGNTEPVAGPSAPLGVDDAARLIDIFLGVCTDYVALPPDELEALRAHLEQAALQIVDPNVGSRLGSCDSATDAGADGGDD